MGNGQQSQSDDPQIAALRGQILDVAHNFSDSPEELEAIMALMLEDVARASRSAIEIMPVCHHSPASALQMVQRLERAKPEAIFLEMSEDLQQLLPSLQGCKLPVALQAFASESEAFPQEWTPLVCVAPLTEFSAEFQAIAYALSHDVELFFVDRSIDHLFQQMPQTPEALEQATPHDQERAERLERDEAKLHGAAIGLQIGSIEPTFDRFLEFLLANARMRNFSEWWETFVEQSTFDVDYETYRHVMFLVGSLLRRLGRTPKHHESDRWRERYMWTRIREHIQQREIDPANTVYICGAIHAVSDVELFGHLEPAGDFAIEPSSSTDWLYGLIPSSYSAIEYQFSHPPGTIALAEASWKKACEALSVKPFKFGAKARKSSKGKALSGEGITQLGHWLQNPPRMEQADEAQLLTWCVDIVKLARKNGYLASTADSIAIYETSKLLANLRDRPHPTPNDFREAALTCLEKTRVPKKRDIPWLCDILLGGDRIGSVSYAAMPELARDALDRLEALPINLHARTIQRALMDFRENPEYLPCSDLLWQLHFLIHDKHPQVLRPIMGRRELGKQPLQESWDIAIGKHQAAIIELGYEGVTVEQVLEQRLRERCFGPRSNTVTALDALRDSLLYLKSGRLTEELGQRAVLLLKQEPSAAHAPAIFERVRELVHYYRATPQGLGRWIKDFVASGYQHFATMLPEAFEDPDTGPDEIAAMLAFVITLESLALSLGCARSQLQIAVRSCEERNTPPDKLGLLWTAEWLLGERSLEEIRAFFDRALDNPLMLPVLPHYLQGFLLAMRFTPLVSRLVVELMSKAFARLPDPMLMSWLPHLMMTLKPTAPELLPALLKEVGTCLPRDQEQIDGWQMPWELEARASPQDEAARQQGPKLDDVQRAASRLLRKNPASLEALAELLGEELRWESPGSGQASAGSPGPIDQMLAANPASTRAYAELLEDDEPT